MIRNLVLDWSGTLINDLPAVLETTNRVFQEAGRPGFTLDQFRREFALPYTDFYAHHLPDIPIRQLEQWFLSHFEHRRDQVHPLPGAKEFLRFCREHGLRTILLSTIHPDHFSHQAEATGLLDSLDEVYIGIRDKRTKIREIMTTHQLAPGETLFVGDMQHDMETARFGGVHCCAVLTGYNQLDQLRQSAPDVICENLTELRRLLEGNDFNFPFRRNHLGASANMPVATVGALIFNPENRVLMLRTQKWSNRWGIPGGKIEYNETSEDALRREVREETALAVGNVRFVMAQDCIQSPEFYREAHFLLLNYTCKTRDGTNVRLNDEAQEFRWVSIAEALAMELNQPTRRLIEAVLTQDH